MRVRRFAAACALASAVVGGCGGGEAPADSGTFVYAGGGSTVHVFRADLVTGALSPVETVPVGNDAYLAEVDRPRKRVYVQTQLGIPVAIRVLDITPTGTLKLVSDHLLPHPEVEGVSQMQFHPTAPWLLISATGGASGLQDQLLPLGAEGQLGMPKIISSEFYGFTWDPTGKYFYGLDGVAISQFTFDPVEGTLTPNEPPLSEGSSGHQFLALRGHPNGKWVYSVEEGAIGVFEVEAARGTLTARSYTPSPIPGEPMSWASLVVHPTGRFLYAIGAVTATQVALIDVFSVDATTGALTFVEREKGGERHQLLLGNFQAPPLIGDLLIVGGQSRATGLEGKPVLAVYRINPADGTLGVVGEPVELRADGSVVNFVFAVTMPKS